MADKKTTKKPVESKKNLALPKEIFDVKPNLDLLHQVVAGYLSNLKKSTAHTKTRGQVAGGGKKPWKQKGTGRARHGSIRSPIWVGGGIVFGPTPAINYKKILPQKMRLGALAQALTNRTKLKKLRVVENLSLARAKTKLAVKLLADLGLTDKTLLVTNSNNQNLVKAARNLPNANVATAAFVTALDILRHQTVIVEKPAIKSLETRFGIKAVNKS